MGRASLRLGARSVQIVGRSYLRQLPSARRDRVCQGRESRADGAIGRAAHSLHLCRTGGVLAAHGGPTIKLPCFNAHKPGLSLTEGTRSATATVITAIASMAQNVRFSECCSPKRSAASPGIAVEGVSRSCRS